MESLLYNHAMMQAPSTQRPPVDTEPKQSNGWWVLLLTVLILGSIMLMICLFWGMDLGQAVHYSQSSGSDAHLRLGEALSGVVSGAAVVAVVLIGAAWLSSVVSQSFGINPSAGVLFVVGLLSAEVTFFIVRPFVLQAQGVYQG